MKRERRNAKDGRSQKFLGGNYRFMEVLQGVRDRLGILRVEGFVKVGWEVLEWEEFEVLDLRVWGFYKEASGLEGSGAGLEDYGVRVMLSQKSTQEMSTAVEDWFQGFWVSLMQRIDHRPLDQDRLWLKTWV